MKSGWILFLPVFCGLPTCAWPQSNSFVAPSITAASSALPDAPDGQPLAPQPISDGTTLGTIHGVVTDRDGSVYEGAHVALSQSPLTSSNVRTVISDSSGHFSFVDITPGPFELTITSSGFSTQVISGVLLAGESYEAKAIVLPMSSAVTEVRVTASTEQIAQAQVNQEEKQRVLGFIPNFYVVYASDAMPLNARQKFDLAWKSSIDPITILTVGAVAGVQQSDNSLSGYGQGAQGYAKRFGANYANTFIDSMIGGAILPSVLKQDPRYFYKGTGTIRSRFFYAVANAVICKGDNGGWQANYSGILGGLAAGGISNLYYPASDRSGVSLTFENALFGIAGGAVQNLFQEFLVRKLTPKVPDYAPSGP